MTGSVWPKTRFWELALRQVARRESSNDLPSALVEQNVCLLCLPGGRLLYELSVGGVDAGFLGEETSARGAGAQFGSVVISSTGSGGRFRAGVWEG